ncbi:hypothetical protein LWC34_48230 [Kibdelosporangium philippinense]|uniref:Cytidyltransferase-like domain-containing protein n=1 Tax=Kibdelosporangium philippinense TaxID=211113 RepID=A0ABS8ZVB0_9PSEU|nr:hypothetical protein [Kibdelosporangium philippinense]MCE7010541.1 hypothetical protein [Kibdelosporangium philippinense]
MKQFQHALVLGKFYPPHLGHHSLIRAAAAASERTTVAVLASSVESIPLAARVSWLTVEHSGDAGVVVVGDMDEHPTDFDDDAIWEAHVAITRSVLSRRAIMDGNPAAAAVDAVFTSEEYGPELAKRFGAQHISIDPDRVTHPVSGTAVRADPRGRWQDLAPATRAGLAARIVVVGAESTGTMTLSECWPITTKRRGCPSTAGCTPKRNWPRPRRSLHRPMSTVWYGRLATSWTSPTDTRAPRTSPPTLDPFSYVTTIHGQRLCGANGISAAPPPGR